MFTMFNWDDIKCVEAMLRSHRPFLHQAILGVDLYDLVSVLKFRESSPRDLVMILDRNVLSRAFELVSPCSVPILEEHRIAAAVCAYALLSDVQFDPTIAFAETVHINGREKGEHEMAKLAAMQNIPAQCFLSVATGRADRIDSHFLDAERTDEISSASRQLQYDQWQRFEPDYIAALKLALLLRKAGPNSEGESLFAAFMRWCYEEFIFTAPGILYGSLALSPVRMKDMFKRVHGRDGSTVLIGVRNATWDLALIRSWMDATNSMRRDRNFAFVCSFDQALRRCANDAIAPARLTCAQQLEFVESIFVRDWGENAGRRLSRAYAKYIIALPSTDGRNGVRDPNRRVRWRAMTADMERELALDL